MVTTIAMNQGGSNVITSSSRCVPRAARIVLLKVIVIKIPNSVSIHIHRVQIIQAVAIRCSEKKHLCITRISAKTTNGIKLPYLYILPFIINYSRLQ